MAVEAVEAVEARITAFVAQVEKKYAYVTDTAYTDGGLVGADRAGREQALHRLERVFLPDAGVTGAGEHGAIAAACGAIEELDLEGNPISEWQPLLDIAVQLPRLHWLGLNRLPLQPLDALPDTFEATLGGLRTLCLSRTGMAWEQLLLIASAMPHLAELHFCANGVVSLEPASARGAAEAEGGEEGRAVGNLLCERLPALRTLWLEDNHLASWEGVAPLASLPHLEALNLSGNRIASLPRAHSGFRSLRRLLLRSNPISDWASIDGLDSLPALSDAALRDLPLFGGMSASSQRRLVIARVGSLATLNGSEVRRREREDAERFYLRSLSESYPEPLPEGSVPHAPPGAAPSPEQLEQLMRRLQLPEGEAWSTFGEEHPRWRALLCLHGVQRAAGGGAAASGTLSAELIELTLRSTAAAAGHLPPLTRRLPSSLPVKSLKAMAGALFKVEPARQVVLYSRPGAHKNDIPESLDDELKRLCDYGVIGGGEIIIEEEDGS